MIRFYRYVRWFIAAINKPYLVSPDDADGIIANEARP